MMYLKKIFLFSFCCLFFLNCNKTDALIQAVSLNVVNTSQGLENAKLSFPTTGYYSQISGVDFGSNAVFTLPAGSSAITITNGLDSTKPIYTGSLTAGFGDVYSLYLAGDVGNDIILKQDLIPAHADSSVGIRFMNLSPGSNAVSVNLVDSAFGSEVPSMQYKDITDFKNYSASGTFIKSGYFLEFRDVDTGDLLATFKTGALPVFKNFTVILYGDPGGQSIMKVGNY